MGRCSVMRSRNWKMFVSQSRDTHRRTNLIPMREARTRWREVLRARKNRKQSKHVARKQPERRQHPNAAAEQLRPKATVEQLQTTIWKSTRCNCLTMFCMTTMFSMTKRTTEQDRIRRRSCYGVLVRFRQPASQLWISHQPESRLERAENLMRQPDANPRNPQSDGPRLEAKDQTPTAADTPVNRYSNGGPVKVVHRRHSRNQTSAPRRVHVRNHHKFRRNRDRS